MASSVKSAGLSISVPSGATSFIPTAPTDGLLIQCVFAVGLIFISSAFTFQLAYDETAGFAGSATLQVITALTGALGLLLIVSSRSTLNLVIRCWPILAIVALAFASATWSFDRITTLRKCYTLLSTVLFVLAIVGRLSPIQCIRLILRVMVLECALSIIWVIVFPEIAIHQPTDVGLNQHVGLWRGIFSHKQGLGVFSGLTTGLLLFYGSVAFRSPIFRIAAIFCSIACLAGAGSTTGWLTMIVTAGVLYTLYGIAVLLVRGVRNFGLNLILLAIICLYYAWSFGLLDFVPRLLGKSSDLSSRTEYWFIAMEVFRASGSTMLGGGYAVGLQRIFPEYVYVDSGYYDLLMQFGYLGSALIIVFVCWILFAGKRLIVTTSLDRAIEHIFPMAMTLVLAFVNISESNFLTSKHISIVLTVLAVAIIVKARRLVPIKQRGGSFQTT